MADVVFFDRAKGLPMKYGFRYVAMVILLSAASIGGFYLLNLSNRRAIETRTLELAVSEGRTIEKVLSKAAAQLLEKGEEPLVRFVSELFANDQVIYVALKRSGRLLHADSKYEGYLPLGEDLQPVKTFDSPLGEIIEVTAALKGPAGKPYSAHIGYQFSVISEMRRVAGRSFLLITLLQAAILLILVSFLYSVNRQMGRKEIEVQLERDERARLQEISLITAGIQHEIRNPLHSLYLSYQMLEPLLDPANEETAFHSRTMKKEIRRIQDIIERFSNLDRAFSIRKEPVDLGPFLSELRDSWAGLEKQPEITIAAEPGAKVQSDPGLLARVVDNIVRNAAEAGAKQVAIRVQTRKGGALITIRDDGPGIKPEHLKFIFDPFVSFKSRGSGIGLALAQRIITQLGGRIKAESVEGEGATLTIVL